MPATTRVALFDFDGTLVDSDRALTRPFEELGVPEDRRPPLGLPLVEACRQAGITVEDYLERYDPSAAQPFDGITELVHALGRWGVASNKQRASGHRELERLGWAPSAAFFSDDFGGREKELVPLLAALDLAPEGAVFIGDTHHDRACAAAVGVPFALAGWNRRARGSAAADDLVLTHPSEVLDLLS
ncbi:MAG TPA: HAD hydrolase-like protein [Acidimicrobiales bacterium]|jgi:phosphoglycolate phosphatase-like HAD superfamily hydrolase|nr:HAD hydrolase-like protein [Acidimicrobiales bacterium]